MGRRVAKPKPPETAADKHQALESGDFEPVFGEFFQRGDHFHRTFENKLPREQRLKRGQYYTPRLLCDFMTILALTDFSPPEGNLDILDPGCGTGMFLERLAACLRVSSEAGKGIVASKTAIELTGVDIDTDAIRYASRLAEGLQASELIGVQLLNEDFLESFPDNIPRFHLVIGNPPYVRQEFLAQAGSSKKTELIRNLAAAFQCEDEKRPEPQKLFQLTGDLYLWFLLKSTLLLKPGGRLVFVTSNSWLATEYGKSLCRFITEHYHVRFLIESACESWFPDAAITPLIMVLDKKVLDKKESRRTLPDSSGATEQKEATRLVRLTRPLAEILLDVPDSADDLGYWQAVETRLQELTGKNRPMDWARIETVLAETLTDETVSWGGLLRSPGTFRNLIGRKAAETLGRVERRKNIESSNTVERALVPEALIPLESLGRIRYPIKTGINDFFYVDAAKIERFGIESDFLYPVLKSSKNIQTYRIHPQELPLRLFACPLSKEALKTEGFHGTLSYVEWGATQVAPVRRKRSEPILWPDVPSVQGRKFWYALEPIPSADFLCWRFFDRRFSFTGCEGRIIEDQTFYGLTLSPEWKSEHAVIGALLNSTFTVLMLELSGRRNLGDGALQFSRGDMASLRVPSPRVFSSQERSRLSQLWGELCHRKLLPIGEEIFQPDKVEIDDMILSKLSPGLSSAKRTALLRAWGDELASLVESRKCLGRTRKKRS